MRKRRLGKDAEDSKKKVPGFMKFAVRTRILSGKIQLLNDSMFSPILKYSEQ